MRLAPHLIAPAAFALAAALSGLGAVWAANVMERRSAEAVGEVLAVEGHGWATVTADGLRVTLSGTAPSEAERFRALSLAGGIVDAARVTDAMGVAAPEALTPPDYTVEILRNDAGVTLIGLVPEATDRAGVAQLLADLAGDGRVADMLETAAHPVPPGWEAALDFGLRTLADLPRAKVSIAPGRVAVTAIADSQEEKGRIEATLARRAPAGLRLALDISAPRPVITPFTLRFVIDAGQPRFDACSADTERARDRILAAARSAGLTGPALCTLGLGVPTPDWAEAAERAIRTLGALGAGSVTFKDADVALLVPASVPAEAFDDAVGELESNLPAVFSLSAEREEPAEAAATAAAPEFSADLTAEGQVTLRGRLADERTREAVENFARARFGNAAVHTAARIDPALPAGWSLRVLAGLEALAEVEEGRLSLREERLSIAGVSGDAAAGDRVARILAARLGEDARVDIAVRYDPARDPELLKPTPDQCLGRIAAILDETKIVFEPGSATITRDGAPVLDRIAEVLRDCPDVPMIVSGHTDSQGRDEMNLALSEARAQSVVVALLDRRVLTSNLVAKGYGETRPVADNGTEDGREANRRIEFALLAPAGPDWPGEGVTLRPAAQAPAPETADAPGGAEAAARETADAVVPETADGAAPEPDGSGDAGPADGAAAAAEDDADVPAAAVADTPAVDAAPGDAAAAGAEPAPDAADPAPDTAAATDPAPEVAAEAPVPAGAEVAPEADPAAAEAAPGADPAAAPAEAVVVAAPAGDDTPRPRAVPESVQAAAAARASARSAELAAAALAASALAGVDLRAATDDTPRPRPRAERTDDSTDDSTGASTGASEDSQ